MSIDLPQTKKKRNNEKGTKKVRSDEKVRRCYKISYERPGYEVTKLRDSNDTYRDSLL
jgi:hypothetical protein